MTKLGIQCKQCGDRLFSYHRHDFVECRCGAIFIDGGDDYMRCGGEMKDIKTIEEEYDHQA